MLDSYYKRNFKIFQKPVNFNDVVEVLNKSDARFCLHVWMCMEIQNEVFGWKSITAMFYENKI